MQVKSHRAKTPRKPMEKNTSNKSKPSVSPSSKSKSISSGTKFLPSQKQNSLSSMHKSSNPPINETLDLIEEDDSSISDINQTTERNNNDIQQSLKMALQFAQFHRKENQDYKAKLKEMEKWEIRSRQLQLQIKELIKTNKSLQEEKNICQEKYKKLKAKYKQIKRIEDNLETQKTQKTNVNLTPCKGHKDQDILTSPYLPHPILLQPQLQLQIQPPQIPSQQPSPQIVHQNSQQSHQQYTQLQQPSHFQSIQSPPPPPQSSAQYQTNITFTNQASDIQHELQSKNKTIQTLCQQICQYQQNSQNVLKLVNVLEQRVQQLSMDNNLLKGMHKQRQQSEYSQKWQRTSQDLKQDKKISVFRDERWDIDNNRNAKKQRGQKKYQY